MVLLAQKLDPTKQIDIANIEHTYSDDYDDFDRADVFLNEWHKKYRKSATIRRLISALKAIGRSDIADLIGIQRLN